MTRLPSFAAGNSPSKDLVKLVAAVRYSKYDVVIYDHARFGAIEESSMLGWVKPGKHPGEPIRAIP